MTAAERRLVGCHARFLRRQRARHWPAVLASGGLVVGLLWSATVALSDAPVWVVSTFWAVVGLGLVAWVGRDLARPPESRIAELERALERGMVSVLRIDCARYAEIEEYEDEGPCLVLEQPDGTLTFLSGQDVYPTPRFPSTEIHFVRVTDRRGGLLLELRRCRGSPLRASRVLPGVIKTRMRWRDDLEVVPGTLEDLDRVLEIGS